MRLFLSAYYTMRFIINLYQGYSHNLWRNLKTKILHIILSHHGEKQYGSPVEPIFPEAVAFHNIDKTDASIQNVKQSIQSDNQEGDWTYDSLQKRFYYKK